MWAHARVPKFIDGQKVIPTEVRTHIERKQKEIDGRLAIEHKPSGDKLTLDYYDNMFLYHDNTTDFPKDKNGNDIWKVTPIKDEYLVDWGTDLGVYSGFIDGAKDQKISSFDVGLRYSPVRIFYGLLSPDALLSKQAFGLGISIYPSPSTWTKELRHVGFGYGRVYTYQDTRMRNLFYISFSTRF
jgi:hypothetical protein